jgi:6-phosphogluconate dehydrogenase
MKEGNENNIKDDKENVFGIYGLGAMGRNLLLNMADHDFAVAGYNRHNDKVALLMEEGKGNGVNGYTELPDFIGSLTSPRVIMLMVTAGKAVDEAITGMLPLLEKGDIIIDGGNSHFTDTARRCQELEEKGFHFIGMGVSGGEEGARNGPSLMPGGDEQAYMHVEPILQAIAAEVDGERCVTFLGAGAAGHFVKMVHNGIEYALMQLIADTFEILKKGLRKNDDEIQKIFSEWNKGRLQSYLIEITAAIFSFKNVDSSHLLLQDIKDEAKAKGTGKWTSQVAMDLGLPIPVIDTAVAMRDLTKFKSLRTKAAAIYANAPREQLTGNPVKYLETLEQAFYFSMVIIYAQGMHLLSQASDTYEYKFELDQIAKIWRGGCIIRSAFLEDIFSAFHANAQLEHLLLDEAVQSKLKSSIPCIRTVVSDASKFGLSVPAYAASLSYFDAFRNEQMPANLIQAQRDFFGAHTYELIDKEGVFHTKWSSV